VTSPTNEEVIRAYLDAHQRHDFDRLGALRAPGWFQEWPQTRERVRGHQNDAAIMRNWPGGTPEPGDFANVVGSEDRWVLTPSWTYQRVIGSGEMWWMDGTGHYPDGSTWHIVGLFQVRDGHVVQETWYFGPPLEAPAWRADWVEKMPPLEPRPGR